MKPEPSIMLTSDIIYEMLAIAPTEDDRDDCVAREHYNFTVSKRSARFVALRDELDKRIPK